MAEELFDLVFKGELVAGFERGQVKQNLQALFRISEAQAEALFAGTVTLKKGLDAEAANKYRVAMKKVGAKVNVQQSAMPAQVAKPSQQQGNPAEPQASAKHSDAVAAGPGTSLGAQAPKPSQPKVEIKAPNYSVAAVGANLLEESEKPEQSAVSVDVSHLAVTPASGNLVSSEELAQLPILEIDVPELDIAPAGADVLRPEERKKVAAVQVDTSGMTIAAAGANLAPPKPPAPPAPNVDHLKLAD